MFSRRLFYAQRITHEECDWNGLLLYYVIMTMIIIVVNVFFFFFFLKHLIKNKNDE